MVESQLAELRGRPFSRCVWMLPECGIPLADVPRNECHQYGGAVDSSISNEKFEGLMHTVMHTPILSIPLCRTSSASSFVLLPDYLCG